MRGFVGRDSDVARVEGLFAEGARLVTLVGAGGMGKSRLAFELAARCSETEVVVCELVASKSAAALDTSVRAAIARALSVPEASRPVADTLSALEPTLLVLDNFEELVPHGVDTLGRWIDAAPEVRFLVTSRVVTGLSTEHVHELEPLGSPGRPEELESSAGGGLLLFHASRAGAPWSACDPDVRTALVELLQRLEGIPLAIELAAARLRTLSPRDLLARMHDRFDALGSKRARVPHHETLERCVAWSWDLLDEGERRALAAVAIFRGGFRIEAAEAVIDPPSAAVALVSSLRDKSLVRVRSDGRFDMLATIRDLALARLRERGEEPAVRARAAVHFAERFAALSVRFFRRQSAAELALIRAEEENLWFALDHSVGPSLQNALAVALEPIVLTRGPSRDDVDRLLPALATIDESSEYASPALRFRAKLATRYFARGSPADDLGRAIALARGPHAKLDAARAHASLSELHRFEGKLALARDHIEAARALLEEDAIALRAGVDWEAGSVYHYLADSVASERAYTSAVIASRESSSRNLALSLYGLGVCHVNRRNVARADELLREALESARSWGLREGELFVLAQLGVMQHDVGALADAEQYLLAAHAIACELDAAVGRAQVEGRLGMLLLERREPGAAHVRLDAALARLGDGSYVATRALFHAARVLLEAGERRIDRAHEELARTKALSRESVELEALHELVSAALVHLEGGLVSSLAAIEGPMASFASVRIFVRIAASVTGAPAFEAAKARFDRIETPRPFSPELVVHRAERRFTPPFGAPVDCTRRGALWQILLALAEAHGSSPGTAMAVDALRAIGWPDERMAAKSAVNRLHVALSTLRRLGLEHALVKEPGGYLLDPNLPVRIVTT